MMQWIPGKSNPKSKMQYSMWSNTLKQALNGVQAWIQANGVEDVDYQVVLERVARFDRDGVAL